MLTLILLALAGTVLAVVVGTFWYSPKTPMGKIHMRYVGFDKLSPEEQAALMEREKPRMPKLYAAQMALSFLTAIATVMTISASMSVGIPAKLAILPPLMYWLCFMVPVIGSGIIWGNCDKDIAWKKFFSDSANNLVTIVLIELLTIAFI